MNVAVIGQGYVGLTAAACLAGSGHVVTGVESDERRLSSLQCGRLHFFEPGLAELVQRGIADCRLNFVRTLAEAPDNLDAILVAVGTPQLPSGAADLSQVVHVIDEIRAMSIPPRLVLMKSTIPPGTSVRLLAESDTDEKLRRTYAYNPEFLSQGQTINGWQQPTRVVVGVCHREVVPIVKQLYEGIEAPWIVTTPTNAEMIKYASNAFLATKISFINEIANLCEDVGADVEEVASGMKLDPRIGPSFLKAGVGYGGSCFPKDTRALTHLSSVRGKRMPLLEAVIRVNNEQRMQVIHRLVEELDSVAAPVVAVLGLSFKPGTDDLREAPSLTIVPQLLMRGYTVRLWDPAVDWGTVGARFDGATACASMEEAVDGAHGALVLTEWREIVEANWRDLAAVMEPPRAVVDGRNCLNPTSLLASGFTYRGVGRASHAHDRHSWEHQDGSRFS